MSQLFVFPRDSGALTTLKVKSSDNDLELPPPRKVARHGSASSPHKHRSSIIGRAGDDMIEIRYVQRPQSLETANLFSQVAKFIRTFLQTDRTDYVASVSLEHIHDACKVLVLEGHQSEALGKVLNTGLRLGSEDISKELKSSNLSLREYLGKLLKWWQWWQGRLDTLRAVLLFLDIVYFASHSEKLSIRHVDLLAHQQRLLNSSSRENGLQRFKDTVVFDHSTRQKIEEALKVWSNGRRIGEPTIDDSQLTQLTKCMEDLDCYDQCIEEPYLRCTAEFYERGSTRDKSQTAKEYLEYCIKAYKQEEGEEMDVLHPRTRVTASIIALQKLVMPHIDLLAREALAEVITTRDQGHFAALHNTLMRVTSSSTSWTTSPSDALLDHYKNDILSRVKDIVTDSENDTKMVDRLLELKEFLDTCLSKEFLDDVDQNERQYTYATSEAFERGFACRRIKPAEMIDKDAFRTFYNRALAKRLLLGRSASDDFEKRVLQELSKSYDVAFTDMTQMFKDLAVSEDLMKDYQKPKRNERQRPDPSLSVSVLQHSVWPIVKKASKTSGGVEIRLPHKMEEALNDYADFYRMRHGNRRLTWAHYLGTATLTAHFPTGKKDLIVSLYQAAVLLLFNERDDWSTEEMEDRLALAHAAISTEMTELVPTIQSLALGNKLVLRRTVKRGGRSVKRDDRFSFNEEFTDSKMRVRINTIQQNDTVEESQQAVKVIDQHRDASLEAAIVRIMKAAKTMKHQQLVNETIDAVSKHFRPDVNAIKSRIESLIEREFITRKDGNANVYAYLA
ncbi:hypothetical protein FRC17_001181 [Serendipita sp. 399]|nr:hypothetical protein FRC17_001181 [Serendipita sp. 399]